MTCTVHFAPRDAGPVSEVAHVRRTCDRVDAGYGSTGGMTKEVRTLAWLDACAPTLRCTQCASDEEILRTVQFGGGTLMSVVMMATEVTEIMASVDAETLAVGDERRWRAWQAILRRIAPSWQGADPCFARALHYAERIEAALAALPIDEELAVWACRHAVGTALAGPGAAGRELRRWASTRPCWFVPDPNFAALYRDWEQHPAGQLTGRMALVAIEAGAWIGMPYWAAGPGGGRHHDPGDPADPFVPVVSADAVGPFEFAAPDELADADGLTPTGRAASDALVAVFGGGWTFRLVDAKVADLLCALAKRAGQGSARCPCADPLAAPVAAAWHDAGMDVDAAVHLAAASVR